MQNRFLRVLTLVVFLAAAVIVGRMIGEAVPGISFLAWLGEGVRFGFEPFTLDLCIVNLTLGFQFSVNIAQIILILALTFVYARWIARD